MRNSVCVIAAAAISVVVALFAAVAWLINQR